METNSFRHLDSLNVYIVTFDPLRSANNYANSHQTPDVFSIISLSQKRDENPTISFRCRDFHPPRVLDPLGIDYRKKRVGASWKIDCSVFYHLESQRLFFWFYGNFGRRKIKVRFDVSRRHSRKTMNILLLPCTTLGRCDDSKNNQIAIDEPSINLFTFNFSWARHFLIYVEFSIIIYGCSCLFAKVENPLLKK